MREKTNLSKRRGRVTGSVHGLEAAHSRVKDPVIFQIPKVLNGSESFEQKIIKASTAKRLREEALFEWSGRAFVNNESYQLIKRTKSPHCVYYYLL